MLPPTAVPDVVKSRIVVKCIIGRQRPDASVQIRFCHPDFSGASPAIAAPNATWAVRTVGSEVPSKVHAENANAYSLDHGTDEETDAQSGSIEDGAPNCDAEPQRQLTEPFPWQPLYSRWIPSLFRIESLTRC